MTPPAHESFALARLMAKHFPGLPVETVWEIGSRDGQDALPMARAFPRASIYAFEPNPATFSAVQEAALSSDGRVHAIHAALTSSDGPVEFMQIDTEQTQTTWADGNPGASSLFRASGEYDSIERYVQRPISVEGARADSIIAGEVAPSPQVVWMDVQGAEALVLEGFGDLLAEVSLIYVELSLKQIYEGQPLAGDIVEMLSPAFYWHSVPHPGPWQFDAVFISRRTRSPMVRLRDRALKAALAAPYRPGVAHPVSASNLRKLGTTVTATAAGTLARTSPWQLNGDTALRTIRSPRRTGRPLALPLRVAMDEALPSDPLSASGGLPAVEIVIPCAPKDAQLLPVVIDGAVKACRNPISAITLVIPDNEEAPDLAPVGGHAIGIRRDADLLDGIVTASSLAHVPPARTGWVRQQLVKIAAAGRSSATAVLVVDADTVLLARRTWLTPGGRQVLCLSREFHEPYREHVSDVWGPGMKQSVSFVTHHQLMQPWVVREMFGEDLSLLNTWVGRADVTEGSALSEYHGYGTWLVNRHAGLVALARWGNVTVRRPAENSSPADDVLSVDRLRAEHPRALSVSLHSYL